ncbi:MAG TPA: hypothetical protein VN673_15815, partial [Clostridia bacterium]|nr:hypothetical protein [Clostridia bacterium]
DMMTWSLQNAYGSSFPLETKKVRAGGWYFSTDQAYDLAVAYQLSAKPGYITALLGNMNYEGGCNPVNVSYLTGIGWKRQRDVVSQWAVNDHRVLPPSGQPVGNITAGFGYLWNYGGMLEGLCFPDINASTAPYPYYDRWSDSWNVTAEFVVLNQARSLGTLSFLAAQTSLRSQAWTGATATLVMPAGVAPVGQPVTVGLQAPGLDLSQARIVWEARDQEPAHGATFTFSPKNNGTQWVEAEALLPDGRRVFAKGTLEANSPDIVWLDDALPQGATAYGEGGDTWNWVSSNPPPRTGTKAHQSALAAGMHQHFFDNATATMTVGPGDVLYAWVYLDPANPPSEIMLQWNDGSWDHRAYWGANILANGADGTASRRYVGPLPPSGQWAQLQVPASQVGLEGSVVKGMAFTLYNGRATWDSAGRLSQATITVAATTDHASRLTAEPGVFTVTRNGDTSKELVVNYALSGTATDGLDYQSSPSGACVTIPAGAGDANVIIAPKAATNAKPAHTVVMSLTGATNYMLSQPASASLTLGGNTVPASLALSSNAVTVTWNAVVNRAYEIFYTDDLTDASWVSAGVIRATHPICSWTGPAAGAGRRYYMVTQVD